MCLFSKNNKLNLANFFLLLALDGFLKNRFNYRLLNRKTLKNVSLFFKVLFILYFLNYLKVTLITASLPVELYKNIHTARVKKNSRVRLVQAVWCRFYKKSDEKLKKRLFYRIVVCSCASRVRVHVYRWYTQATSQLRVSKQEFHLFA